MIRIYHNAGPLRAAPRLATLTFRPDGTASCLYTEAIDLSTLGRLHVRRATRIEFDDRLQAWRVWNEGGQVLYTAPTRQACLDWEHQHYNQ